MRFSLRPERLIETTARRRAKTMIHLNTSGPEREVIPLYATTTLSPGLWLLRVGLEGQYLESRSE